MLGGKLREGGAGCFVQLLRHPHFSSQYGLDGKHIVALLCAHILRHMFPGCLVSLRGDLGWPARSPNLSICDFFLLGYLKEKVFRSRPHTLQQLREQTIEEVNATLHRMCERAVGNFRIRLQQCVAADGRYLADIIFRT